MKDRLFFIIIAISLIASTTANAAEPCATIQILSDQITFTLRGKERISTYGCDKNCAD